MIIRAASLVPNDDIARQAWAGLARFQNIPFVEEQICRLHSLGKEQRRNARKQARQMRYALIQAKEYFDAARSVTLATKPNLLYYCIMSLALAEILLKQTGLSSLDRARDEHRHHGLVLKVADLALDADLETASSALRAVPSIGSNGNRLGTFELWHRSCREMPLCGTITTNDPEHRGSSSAFRAVLTANDQRLPLVPAGGLSLLECLCALPGMVNFLPAYAIAVNIVRGNLKITETLNPLRNTLTLIIHPGPSELVNTFLENIKLKADAVDRTNLHQMPAGGGIATFVMDEVYTDRGIRNIPNGSMWRKSEARFWPTQQPLNEFGFLYVALYIVGNYARYFPDRWVLDVEQASPLALAVDELVELVQRRMPLLALSELTQIYQVPDD
jgi:hypothetical protein